MTSKTTTKNKFPFPSIRSIRKFFCFFKILTPFPAQCFLLFSLFVWSPCYWPTIVFTPLHFSTSATTLDDNGSFLRSIHCNFRPVLSCLSPRYRFDFSLCSLFIMFESPHSICTVDDAQCDDRPYESGSFLFFILFRWFLRKKFSFDEEREWHLLLVNPFPICWSTTRHTPKK